MWRTFFFVAILIALTLPAFAIMSFLSPSLPQFLQDDLLGDRIAVFLVESIPLFSSDIALVVELTPAAIAAALAVFAPSSDRFWPVAASLIACVLGYTAFFALSWHLNDKDTLMALDVIMQNASIQTKQGPVEATRELWLPVLSNFASGTRMFYAIIAFSIVGIKLRPGGGLK